MATLVEAGSFGTDIARRPSARRLPPVPQSYARWLSDKAAGSETGERRNAIAGVALATILSAPCWHPQRPVLARRRVASPRGRGLRPAAHDRSDASARPAYLGASPGRSTGAAAACWFGRAGERDNSGSVGCQTGKGTERRL